MPDEVITSLGEKLNADDPRIQVAQICSSTNGFEYRWKDGDATSIAQLSAGIPNGRETRWRRLDPVKASAYLAHNFASIIYLGDFDAFLSKDTRTIEAAVLHVERFGGTAKITRTLPGVKKLRGDRAERQQLELQDEPLSDSDSEAGNIQLGDDWEVVVEQAPGALYSIALGSSTERFGEFTTQRYRTTGRYRQSITTLRIHGVTASRHDDALRILQDVANSFFFELDLSFDLALRLAPAAPNRLLSPRQDAWSGNIAPQSVRHPRTQYSDKPLSLYWYARSSIGLPLLEYLAYYQVLEYYFPIYSRRDALTRMRNELIDPRFRPEDDAHLSRLFSIVSQSGKGFGTEREQLKSTLLACTSEHQVGEFITQNSWLTEHLKGKQVIKQVSVVNTQDSSGLLPQIANRVYDIRCRIVHAKEDGGGKDANLLLPFSKEAEALGPDIQLIKFLAQKCLIAGASRLQA
ncbi:hypothetical protein [Streptomyces sp. NPDC096324]|uniref:hypothetical protein n=1 Tax=Streptomyces sp. NPDC096324 TaxID=3366085 RepID=UPI00382864DA